MAASCHLLILAAGAGARMGGPKALLEQRGVPLLAAHVERAFALGVRSVSAIVRPEVESVVSPHLTPHGGRLSLLAARTDSQAGSLALLVRELARAGRFGLDDPFLITPVDVLPCVEATYRALCSALDRATLAATPTFQGRGGHPVLVRGELLSPCLQGSYESSPTLRDLLHAAAARRRRVAVDDASILLDLDRPDQAAACGLRLPWAAERAARPLDGPN